MLSIVCCSVLTHIQLTTKLFLKKWKYGLTELSNRKHNFISFGSHVWTKFGHNTKNRIIELKSVTNFFLSFTHRPSLSTSQQQQQHQLIQLKIIRFAKNCWWKKCWKRRYKLCQNHWQTLTQMLTLLHVHCITEPKIFEKEKIIINLLKLYQWSSHEFEYLSTRWNRSQRSRRE